jgi:hypothetical protein
MGIGFAIVYSALYQAGYAWQRWVHRRERCATEGPAPEVGTPRLNPQ